MDPAPSDRLITLPRPAGEPPPELSAARLGEVFGIPDLPQRLGAVDNRITDVLGAGGALLGPASVRVASAGGKRLRPLFTIVCATTGDAFNDRVVDAAAAVELVQVGSLVHDDILDDAATRRGRPTINAVEGVNHAVMAGDYILARAAELAARVSREAAALIASALGDLCEGQVLELRDAHDPGRTVDAHLESVRGKTAALFECACRLGAHCAGLAARTSRRSPGSATRSAWASRCSTTCSTSSATSNASASRPATTSPAASTRCRSSPPSRVPKAIGCEARSRPVAPTSGRVALAIELVRRSGAIAEALNAADRYGDEARPRRRPPQPDDGRRRARPLPRLYATWSLER